jgi:hypothetical protein
MKGMKASARTAVLPGAALAALLLLSACGKHDNEATPPPPAAASTAATPPAAATAPTPATTAPTPAAPASTSVPASSGSSAAATPATDAGFAVASLQLGDAVNAAHKITEPGNTFAPSQKTLYASVETIGTTDEATLAARWSYLEGRGQLVSAISQSIATDGPATTTFKVHNPDAWPAGKYKVEISLDGKPVTSQTFEIKAPG